MTGRGLRLRAVIDDRFAAVVVALVVLAAVGGWLTYGAYGQTDTHQERRQVDEWHLAGSFTHGATVTEPADGTVFEPNTTVRNRSAYLLRAMPVLEGQFRLGYAGGDAPVDLRIERHLVVRQVGLLGDDGQTVFWQDRRSLGTNETSLGPGDETAVPFSVDVGRTLRRAANASDRLGSPGTTNVGVQFTVEATRQTAEAETRRVTYVLPIDAGSGVYRVRGEPRTETFSRTALVPVEDESGPTSAYGGPLALLVGGLGAAGVLVARSRSAVALSAVEREWLAYRSDRAEFDEWIATVRLPEAAEGLPVAEPETLGDLVSVAIDADASVLESPDGDRYHVVHDGYRYTFDPPPAPGERRASPSSEPPGGHDGRSPGRADPSGRPDDPQPGDTEPPPEVGPDGLSLGIDYLDVMGNGSDRKTSQQSDPGAPESGPDDEASDPGAPESGPDDEA
jgi:hypothetical protein